MGVGGQSHDCTVILGYPLIARKSLQSLRVNNSLAQNLLKCNASFFLLVLLFVEMGNNQCLSYNDLSNLLDLFSLN